MTFSFFKIPDNCMRKIPEFVPSSRRHGWEEAKKICNSNCFRITNLEFSSVTLTSKAKIYTKFDIFKLCIQIIFNNICLTTSEKQIILKVNILTFTETIKLTDKKKLRNVNN